ncbi:chaperonin GroEL, partial [Candidatus Amesbacteria bacterium]|nr:chaperonin GroEL [Candidatus Amesbacteria bacterium]
KSALNARISQLKEELAKTTSDFDKEKIEERLAKLSGGVAVISVGAANEVELNDRKERVKDAVGATKAAVEEGIVPGGEVTLLRAARALDGLKLENDEKVGLDILRYALEQPFRWLLKNAGLDDGYFLVLVQGEKALDFGINVATSQTGSMYQFGIIDPAKVTRSALQNAASVGTMILTTEALVTEIVEPKKETSGAGAPGMGGGMGEDY